MFFDFQNFGQNRANPAAPMLGWSYFWPLCRLVRVRETLPLAICELRLVIIIMMYSETRNFKISGYSVDDSVQRY